MAKRVNNYVRGIDNNFISDLNSGILSSFLSLCKGSDYSLEIRDNYINVYYKGGNTIKISQLKKDYSFHFNLDYCLKLNNTNVYNFNTISNLNRRNALAYFYNISLISFEMDTWFKVHPNPERDFQHTLTKNTHSNFQIIDIEYAIRDMNIWNLNIQNGAKIKSLFKLDMLVSYEQNGQQKLIIVENKFGDNLGGSSGVKQHLVDINHILNDKTMRAQLISSTNSVIKNKMALGLINNIALFDNDSTIEVLFILANYGKSISYLESITNTVSTFFVKKAIIIPKGTVLKNYSIDYSKAIVL